VDDWNLRRTRIATWQELGEQGWGVLFDVALPARRNDRSRWWNGLFVAVIDKRQVKILDFLRTRMTDKVARRSLHEPIKELLGLTPAEAIKRGMFQQVERVIKRLMMIR